MRIYPADLRVTKLLESPRVVVDYVNCMRGFRQPEVQVCELSCELMHVVRGQLFELARNEPGVLYRVGQVYCLARENQVGEGSVLSARSALALG